MNRHMSHALPAVVVFLVAALLLFEPILSFVSGTHATAQADEVQFYESGRSDPILSDGGGGGRMGAVSTSALESRHLREARRYRAQGRYELARQSYVLALSICGNTRRLATIRHELDGLELMLRTLR